MFKLILTPFRNWRRFNPHRVEVGIPLAWFSDAVLSTMAGDPHLCVIAMEIVEHTRPQISKALAVSLFQAPLEDVRVRMRMLIDRIQQDK